MQNQWLVPPWVCGHHLVPVGLRHSLKGKISDSDLAGCEWLSERKKSQFPKELDGGLCR